MHLTFGTPHHTNMDISDGEHRQYTISTPSASKPVTTITKYHWNGSRSVPETMGVIEWYRTREAVFRFNGRVTPANKMLEKRLGDTYVDPNVSTRRGPIDNYCGETSNATSDRYFVGPDQPIYK